MQKKHLILALLFGIPSVSLGAADPSNVKFQSSPYKACQDVALISRNDYNQNKEFWDVAVKECGADVQVLPESGFLAALNRTIHGRFGGNGEDNLRTEEFLRKVGGKALEYSESNNRLNEVIAACAAGDEAFLKAAAAKETTEEGKKFYAQENCSKRIEDVKDVVDEYGSPARVQYALMQKLGSLFGKAGKVIKTTFNMQTDLEKAPLSPEEKALVEKKFAEINKRMEKKFDEEMKGIVVGSEGTEAMMAMTMDRIRTEELKPITEEFTNLMQKAPMLAFISKSGRPTSADLSVALGKVLENGKAESKKIREALAAADKATGTQNRSKKLMEFMNYGPVLEEVLKKDPSFCQNSTTLANYVSNKELGKAGLAMGAILATGFAGGAVAGALGAGTLVAGAVGTAASLAPTYKMVYEVDRDKYLSAYQRNFAAGHTVEGKEGANKNLADYKEFEEARDSLAMDIATAPLDLMGLGIGKGLVAGATGAYTGAKMLAKPGAVRAAQKALLKKGFSALDAGKILADIKGTDATKAARALAILTEAVGVDAKELKVARNLVAKGVLKEGDVEAFDRAMKTLREVKPEERAAVYARMDKTLEHLNTAKINAGNRDQAFEAVAAGSRFGASPEYVAAKVTDWDGGLDGLARAYDTARQEMDTPAVRGLASDDLRRDAAFDSALRKLGVSDDKVRAQMKACGLGK